MVQFTNSPEQSLFQATLRSPINASDTTGIVLSRQIESFTGTIRITILDPAAGAEVISATGQTVGGELTGVVRGLPLYDGGPSTASTHPSGTRVVLSNPFQLYKDIETAINSKADRDEDTVNKLTVEDWLELQSYPDATARDVAIAVPVKDMIVILDDDGDGKVCFSVYDGANWKNIALPGRDVVIEGFLRVESGYVKLPIYADATARDAAITSPEQSMIIYNVNAVTFQFYDGSNWNDLDVGTPVPLATTSVPGRVRLATDQQVIDRVDDVGGNPLVMQPSQLSLAHTVNVVPLVDIPAGTPVGVPIGNWDSSQPIPIDILTNNASTPTNLVLPGVTPTAVQSVVLDDERIFVTYREDTINLNCIILTIDKSTGGFTLGTPQTINSDTSTVRRAIKVDNDEVLITYIIPASNTIVRTKRASITGNSISLGSQVDAFTHGSAVTSILLVDLDTDLSVICVNGNTVRALDTSSGVTAGSAETPAMTVNRMVNSGVNRFTIGGFSTTVQLQIGVVTGTAIVLGTAYSVAGTALDSMIKLSNNIAAIIRSTSSTALNIELLDVSGVTPTVILTQAESNALGSFGALKRISNTMVAYNFRSTGVSPTQTRYGYLSTTEHLRYFNDASSTAFYSSSAVEIGNYVYTSQALTDRHTACVVPVAFTESNLIGGVVTSLSMRGNILTHPEAPAGLPSGTPYNPRTLSNNQMTLNEVHSSFYPIATDKVIFL
jgi:hypothetical protein